MTLPPGDTEPIAPHSAPVSDGVPAPHVQPGEGPVAAEGPLAAASDGVTNAAAAPTHETSEAPTTGSRRRRFRTWRFAPVIEVIATIALALALAEGVQAAVVKPFVIPSQSMEPTLIPSQRVLVNRLAFDFGSPQRGDIVVFHPPVGETCAANPIPAGEPCPRSNTTPAGVYYVKRVIGLPGDTLSIERGHPVINGHLLSHEPYIIPCGDAPECNMPDTITIPRGEYFMMGDNRGDSDDSRIWGPIPGSWIIGEVFATYWPPDRIGIF
jgi:signal peptidase I